MPSATIVFSPDSLEEIKFTFDKSFQSLWYGQLCDFIDKTNPFNWSAGNSGLVPTVYDNWYLGYSYNKDTWNINTDVFYSITNNDISFLSVPVTDVITLTTPENIAHHSSVGIELASWLSIKQKYDFNFSSAVNYTYINASGLNGTDITKKDYGYNFKFNTDIHLSKKTTATFYVNYFSREVIFTGYNFDYFNSSISFTHKFFDNKLLLTFGANNIFDNLLKHGSYYNYSGFIQNTIKYSSSYLPAYFITLQYKFRQGDRGTKDACGAMKMGK
jgi:outer membrane receptor for ferrienterochelin and colicin